MKKTKDQDAVDEVADTTLPLYLFDKQKLQQKPEQAAKTMIWINAQTFFAAYNVRTYKIK